MLRSVHKHSARHAEEVTSSVACGCFFCLAVFLPDEIRDWLPREETALCPRCNIDAVIGDRSGLPAKDIAFLKAMHDEWFEGLRLK
ncbi:MULTISPECIES: cytoplasmic protein [unclassified Methylobacterium]|uniref:cytoplasmic protein n=1 Tax=unclassified Methylobacterium TaxID=2615210 RepID=UPI0009EADB91|nr:MULTISPECIES: cytoplasmic protein [unclassified Methylobacterium]